MSWRKDKERGKAKNGSPVKQGGLRARTLDMCGWKGKKKCHMCKWHGSSTTVGVDSVVSVTGVTGNATTRTAGHGRLFFGSALGGDGIIDTKRWQRGRRQSETSKLLASWQGFKECLASGRVYGKRVTGRGSGEVSNWAEQELWSQMTGKGAHSCWNAYWE